MSYRVRIALPMRLVLAGLGGGLMLGFVIFAERATAWLPQAGSRADGAVVLTGGEERLSEGGRLLQQGRSRRLLISGVNPRTSTDDLRRLTGLDRRKFDCCVDVGYLARDTMGNAEETRAWAHAQGFTSLIVVTANYHMPRSLAEFELAMPGARLIAHPVVPHSLGPDPWWINVSAARILLAEYLKYLPSAVRFTTARLWRLLDGEQTGQAGATVRHVQL